MRIVTPVAKVVAPARGVIDWLRQKIVTLRRIFDEKAEIFGTFSPGNVRQS